jgi:hypothetical protein
LGPRRFAETTNWGRAVIPGIWRFSCGRSTYDYIITSPVSCLRLWTRGNAPWYVLDSLRKFRVQALALIVPLQLIFSVFKTLTDQRVTVELKNDLSITGTLKSVDQ